MDTKYVAGTVESWGTVVFSDTLIAIHLPILITVLAVILYAAQPR